MEITAKLRLNLKTTEAMRKVNSASEGGLRDTIVAISRDVVKGSPVLWGTNRRSIDYEVRGLTGKIFGTSGYSGFLEVGTIHMPARPYFRVALDKNIKKLPSNIKTRLGHG